ncbi:hypothetical protein N7519_009968 [Penicillium mononematosum]|uniref:uncharacterized protein n=1 Tax=Penicillium mononematosum TaxID=268346 RepID=UPI00254770D3|nr:uncharacterized protein N7519_009968 [Penicillium mononematosum]KAJ6179507.1 hypothetical protein N7519_009968 [Penicillium mononematosum]
MAETPIRELIWRLRSSTLQAPTSPDKLKRHGLPRSPDATKTSWQNIPSGLRVTRVLAGYSLALKVLMIDH